MILVIALLTVILLSKNLTVLNYFAIDSIGDNHTPKDSRIYLAPYILLHLVIYCIAN